MHDHNARAAAGSPLTLTIDRLLYATCAERILHEMRAGGVDAAHAIGAHHTTCRETSARMEARLHDCERFRAGSSTPVTERMAAP